MAQTNPKLISDVLHLAANREEQAYNFYNSMAEKVADIETKHLFTKLSEEELVHKENINLEIMKNGNIVIDQTKALDDIEQYDLGINFHPEISIQEAILMAIGKEKASFRFYVSLAMLITEKETREICLELAEQEAMHIAVLEIEYNELFEQ